MENNKPKSIFFAISSALRGNKKDVVDASEPKNLLTNQPEQDKFYDFNNIQQKQQDYLDIQSQKIAQDIYSRSVYYDADRISSYNDYRAMDQSPEISVALDIMSDECIEASTIIPLLNGEKITVEELFNEKKQNFWVYSYNIEKNIVEPAICERIAYKGEQNVYKITFDDNSSVMTTDEHLWLMKKDKSYKKTKDLIIGESIQPFYTRISSDKDRIKGYEMILEDNGKWEYTHRVVKRKINPEQKGVCHHKDFNKLNNQPENLQVMNYFDHQKLHSSLNTEKWKNEDFANKMRKIFSETNSKIGPYWTNPEWSEKRKKDSKVRMVKYMSTLSDTEKKEKFGLPGKKNGMYNNGHKLKGEKNGRYNPNFKREFTYDEIINAYLNSKNIDEACTILQTTKETLRKSKIYKSLNIDRWEDLNITTNNLTLKGLNEICEEYCENYVLERNASRVCKALNVKPKIVDKLLKKEGYENWCDFVKKFNSKDRILDKLKKQYINTPPNKNGEISLSYFCAYNNKSSKQLEGFINSTKYSTWTKFKESINHSIKSIELVGIRKTYDLINVSENNNYAIITDNGTGVFVHNCVTRDDYGDILSIYSNDNRIKKVLKQLFHQTLNVDFNLWFWTRELLKYGDNFLKLEIDQKLGIYDIIQLPAGEIHKELGVDGNPKSVRYKWDINGMYFEDFEIAHFSLISDGTKLPYGRSVLDPARKLWKQLQLAEDAMLVYRLVRAPERRIFYLDIGNLDAADVKQYMEAMKRELKKQPVVDSKTGNVNFKFNPVTFEEDYFIPVRGGISSKIETLPGASNLSDIADIEYLQNKLFTAIKVPKTYLNYAEGLPGGSTLSQADLRFARTINRIQEMVIMELRRIANIHLYILGFEDDLDNFTLTLTNPSTQQELLKLETMKARNDVFKEMFSSDATSPVSYAWAMENILGFSKAEIKQILRQKKVERKMFYEIERAHLEYMDTGIFNELDKKFRRPDFDPNEDIDPDGENGGGSDGGSDGGFGGGASFGGMDMGGAGGGMGDLGGEGDDLSGLDGGEAGAPDLGGPEGTELGGAEETAPEEADNLKETNTLLKKNKTFNFKTKNLLEGIEHYLKKIKEDDEQ